MATPVRAQLLATLGDFGLRQQLAAGRLFTQKTERVRLLARTLMQPERTLEIRTQKLDHTTLALQRALEKSRHASERRLGLAAQKLRTPDALVQTKRLALTRVADRLVPLLQRSLERRADRTDTAARMLETLSFRKVLARGYAVVRQRGGSTDGALVKNSASLKAGMTVSLTFHDGAPVDATIIPEQQDS